MLAMFTVKNAVCVDLTYIGINEMLAMWHLFYVWLRFDLQYLTFKLCKIIAILCIYYLRMFLLDPIQVCSEEMNFWIFISIKNSGYRGHNQLNQEVTRILLVYLFLDSLEEQMYETDPKFF